MSIDLFSVETIATFGVSDEPPMPSLLGPDATMVPYQANIRFIDGEFREMVVLGNLVGTRGQRTTRDHRLTFSLADLRSTSVPDWMRDLAVRATFGRGI